MKTIHYIILLCILALATTACNDHSVPNDNGAYHLTLVIDKGLKGDSASLYIVEDGYRRLIDAGMRTGHPSTTLSWDGHIDGARVAFIKWKENPRPLYFILEPGDINISIHRDRWIINGGQYNSKYINFINTHRQIIIDKDNNYKEYMSHAADSTLTPTIEKQYVMRDSILTDSIQRHIVNQIMVDDPVSIIVRERYYNTLTRHYQQIIK